MLIPRNDSGIEGVSLVDDFKCAARSSEADLGASQPSGFGRPGHGAAGLYPQQQPRNRSQAEVAASIPAVGGRAHRGARDEDDDNEML